MSETRKDTFKMKMRKLKLRIDELEQQSKYKCPVCLDQLVFDRSSENHDIWYCGTCPTTVKVVRDYE